jgi:hypothetical protein
VAEALLPKGRPHALTAFIIPVDFVPSDLKVPSTYLICENDKIMKTSYQEMLAGATEGMKIERCFAGHFPFLSQVDRTVEVIVKVSER